MQIKLEARGQWQPPPDDTPGPGGPAEIPDTGPQAPVEAPSEVPAGPGEIPEPPPPETT